MTDPTIIAAALVMVIASIAAAVVSIINAKAAADERIAARHARVDAAALAETAARKADTLIEKTVEIHELANSQLSTVTTSLQIANEKIEGLQALVKSLGPKENP